MNNLWFSNGFCRSFCLSVDFQGCHVSLPPLLSSAKKDSHARLPSSIRTFSGPSAYFFGVARVPMCFSFPVQRYNMDIAVYECRRAFFHFSTIIAPSSRALIAGLTRDLSPHSGLRAGISVCVTCVIWSFGQNRKRMVKNRHYNINILFIYSEQNDQFKIENDQMTF